MSENRIAASTPWRRTGCRVISVISSGSRQASSIDVPTRRARYSGSERPAWRMNHTGGRAPGGPVAARTSREWPGGDRLGGRSGGLGQWAGHHARHGGMRASARLPRDRRRCRAKLVPGPTAVPRPRSAVRRGVCRDRELLMLYCPSARARCLAEMPPAPTATATTAPTAPASSAAPRWCSTPAARDCSAAARARPRRAHVGPDGDAGGDARAEPRRAHASRPEIFRDAVASLTGDAGCAARSASSRCARRSGWRRGATRCRADIISADGRGSRLRPAGAAARPGRPRGVGRRAAPGRLRHPPSSTTQMGVDPMLPSVGLELADRRARRARAPPTGPPAAR